MIRRREFMFGGTLATLAQAKLESLQVEVMEVFSSASGPSALLVHHVDERLRDAFANWLRANSGKRVVCTLTNKAKIDARIFRMGQCFGRGLILLREPAPVHAKDILSIT